MINVLERLRMAAYVIVPVIDRLLMLYCIFALPWVLIIKIIKTKGKLEEDEPWP